MRQRRAAESRGNPFYVACGFCKAVWVALELPMAVGEFTDTLKAMRCPRCKATPKDIRIASAADVAAFARREGMPRSEVAPSRAPQRAPSRAPERPVKPKREKVPRRK